MKIHDENKVPQFLKMINDLTSTHLEIGIFGEDDSEILMIANINEFGYNFKVSDKMRAYLHDMGLHLKETTTEIKVPERSFMRAGYDKEKSNMIDKGEILLKKVITLQLSVDTFYKTLGEYIVGLLQDYLTTLKNPPNHQFTIEQKGSSNPLIDTQRLRESITYKVVMD